MGRGLLAQTYRSIRCLHAGWFRIFQRSLESLYLRPPSPLVLGKSIGHEGRGRRITKEMRWQRHDNESSNKVRKSHALFNSWFLLTNSTVHAVKKGMDVRNICERGRVVCKTWKRQKADTITILVEFNGLNSMNLSSSVQRFTYYYYFTRSLNMVFSWSWLHIIEWWVPPSVDIIHPAIAVLEPISALKMKGNYRSLEVSDR
jgi:hypothetical protein